MRILLLSHSLNSLTQRLHVELIERGHEVSVEFDINDAVTIEAVDMFRPDVIVAPFLKRAIPEAVFANCLSFVVHPGPPGDRGPAALDWAILDGKTEWGVTVLEATAELDGGPVWAYRRFAMRSASKSSLYRTEVTEAAVAAVLQALRLLEEGHRQAPQFDELDDVAGVWRGPARQADRAIDWVLDDCETVLRKIASGDGTPGVRASILGRDVFLHNASKAAIDYDGAMPGSAIARSHDAVALATRDGAVWIGHMRQAGTTGAVKLPAARVLGAAIADLPLVEGPDEIRYEEAGLVGLLHFRFLNGAMGVDACERLLAAYEKALMRPTRVLMLTGGPDFWSNGLDLNDIEAAASAADQSWANISAIDDLSEAIVRTTDRLVISALSGNAGAGGVFLARAADEVWARRGVILNPHYKDMGNLYGSELWTYLLPKHAGDVAARRIMQSRLPMGVDEAARLRLVDRIVEGGCADFMAAVAGMAEALTQDPDFEMRIAEKAKQRAVDEAVKPLRAYRDEELSRMRRNFYGFDPSYHIARYNFVHKVAKSRTPLTIARHRDKRMPREAILKGAAE